MMRRMSLPFDLKAAWKSALRLAKTLVERVNAAGIIRSGAMKELRRLLEEAEAAVRRLLLIEAYAIDAPAPAPKSPRTSKRQAMRLSAAGAGRAARPLFRLAPQPLAREWKGPQAAQQTARSQHVKTNTGDLPLRFARRMEALVDVLKNPKPHVRRMARLLGRDNRIAMRIVTDISSHEPAEQAAVAEAWRIYRAAGEAGRLRPG